MGIKMKGGEGKEGEEGEKEEKEVRMDRNATTV